MEFLLNTRTSWDEPPRARHQLAESLAKRYPVVFISQNQFGQPALEAREAAPNLTVLMPCWPVPGKRRYRMPGINEIYQRWLFRTVAQRFRPTHVVNFDHTATQLTRYFDDPIYYCNDYQIRNFGVRPIREYFEYCEAKVAKRSRLCIGTCDYLRHRLARSNPNTFEIRLGAPYVSDPPVIREKKLPIKVALVDFTRHAKTPFDVLESIDADSRFELHLYGPVTDPARRILTRTTNIQFGGVLKGRALIEAMRQMDVGIAVYKTDDGNPGRTPNKLWLYLAAGLPCVVTDLPTIRGWDFDTGFVYRVEDNRRFGDWIAKAHDDNTQRLALKRFEFAKQNSWENRVQQLLDIVNGHSVTTTCPVRA